MQPEVTLCRFTVDGFTEIEEGLDKIVQAIQKNTEKIGGRFKGAYLTQGRYDLVVETEMPNPEASIQAWLPILKTGWLHTETLVGVPYENARQVIQESRQLQQA